VLRSPAARRPLDSDFDISTSACSIAHTEDVIGHRPLSSVYIIILRNAKTVKVEGVYSWLTEKSGIMVMGRHLPYGITQCYLPPDTSERAPP